MFLLIICIYEPATLWCTGHNQLTHLARAKVFFIYIDSCEDHKLNTMYVCAAPRQ